MNIDIKLEGIEEAIAMFDPKVVKKATASAINKVAGKARTEASSIIREEYNIKAGDLGKYLTVSTKATQKALYAVIAGRKRGIPLYYYDARQADVKIIRDAATKSKYIYIKPGRWDKTGAVSVMVKRQGGRRYINQEPKPFIQKMKSGHIGIFARLEKARLPIKELLGPGVALLFGQIRVMGFVKGLIQQQFPKIFKDQLDYFSKK